MRRGATFFSGSLRKYMQSSSVLFYLRLLFPRFSLCARDVDEMSSSLISLWLMRGLINNSLISDEEPARVSRNLPMWVSADARIAEADV